MEDAGRARRRADGPRRRLCLSRRPRLGRFGRGTGSIRDGDETHEITGDYPAVGGQGVGFSEDGDMEGVNFRQQVIDETVALLPQLRDASIPVLWRPHHDMNRS